MENSKLKDPLHGITLLRILEQLVEYYGFDTLGELIKIKCFTDNPSIKSSLTFLRKTDWARKQVRICMFSLYLNFPNSFRLLDTVGNHNTTSIGQPFATFIPMLSSLVAFAGT